MGTHFIRRGLTITVNYARAPRVKLHECKSQRGTKSAEKVSLILAMFPFNSHFLTDKNSINVDNDVSILSTSNMKWN